jgi:hypothetical protein
MSPNQLFTWRRLVVEGALTAGETVGAGSRKGRYLSSVASRPSGKRTAPDDLPRPLARR